MRKRRRTATNSIVVRSARLSIFDGLLLRDDINTKKNLFTSIHCVMRKIKTACGYGVLSNLFDT